MKSKEKRPFHTAAKNAPGEWLVTRLLVQRSTSRAFGTVRVYADPAALRLRGDLSMPLIYCATHSGWWDGYIADLLNRRLFKRDGYLMMEEVHLARYPFFTWAGVYGVDRHNARHALASLDYTAQLLTEKPGRAVGAFPQGTITPPDRRPLGLYNGVSRVVRAVGRCAIVPIALRYEFLMEQAPDAFARVGAPVVFDMAKEPLSSKEITARIEEAMVKEADALHCDVIAYNLEPYRVILRGRSSANRGWDGFLKVLGSLKRLVVRPGGSRNGECSPPGR